MTTLRTAHRRARKALRAKVLAEAFAYDMDRLTRLTASGRLDKRSGMRSGFVRRRRRKDKALNRKKERV